MSEEFSVVKFQGGQCSAVSCGSKNPVVAMLAQTMLAEANQFSVAAAQDVQAQSVGQAQAASLGFGV